MIVKGSMNYTTSGRRKKTNKTGTISRKEAFTPYTPGNGNSTYQAYVKQRDSIKSIDIDPIAQNQEQLRYEGELAEREAAAQVEIERKKMRTAPAYSKGAYQYISELDLPYLGRKI
jgi:hypothetical protein